MEDRYIMMVDENGQPFICHAGMFQKAGNVIKSAGSAAVNAVRGVGRGRGTRQNHKYLMKVGAPEKPRYLYTQEEVRAYLQGGRRALNNAVDKAGQTAKNAVNTAKNTASNATNKAGQTAKNVVNTAKNAVNKAVDVVKDKAGVDERKRAEEAWDKVPRRVSSDDKEAVEAFRKATEAQKEYRKTPLGAAEYAKERAYEIATGQDGNAKEIAEKVVDSAKSKYDRMREEFKDTSNKVKNAFKKEPPKAELSPEGAERILKENIIPEIIIREDKIHENKIKENVIPEKKVVEKANSEEKVSSSSGKSKFGEYKDDDPDFSDENYDKAARIGDSDFVTFKRNDGTSVILEEDMKWVLPKGVNGNDPAIRKAITDFENRIISEREKGNEKYTNQNWEEWATEAIDSAIEEAQKKNK